MTIGQDKIQASFDRDFARYRTFAILDNGDAIGLVALKYPADAAGRVVAYVHVYGQPMARGYGGYGYDKATAAVTSAIEGMKDGDSKIVQRLRTVTDNGHDFRRQIENAGFTLARGC